MEAARGTTRGDGVPAPYGDDSFDGGGGGGGCCAGLTSAPPRLLRDSARETLPPLKRAATSTSDQHEAMVTTQKSGVAITPTPAAARSCVFTATARRHEDGGVVAAPTKYSNDDNDSDTYPFYSNNHSSNISSNSSRGGSSPAGISPLPRSSDLTSELEIIKEAQRTFVCPDGFKLAAIPPPSANRSVIYMYGVRVDEIQTPAATAITNAAAAAAGGGGGGSPMDQSKAHHARKGQKPSGRYYCLASKGCRETRTYLKLPKGGTSSATDHLGNLHGPMFKIKFGDPSEPTPCRHANSRATAKLSTPYRRRCAGHHLLQSAGSSSGWRLNLAGRRI